MTIPCTKEDKIDEIHADVKEIKKYIFNYSNRITRIETFLVGAWSIIILGLGFLMKR